MNTTATIILSIILVVILFLFFYVRKKINPSQIQQVFSCTLVLMLDIVLFLLLQLLCSGPLNINPIYFDYFVYIGTVFLPISILFTALVFSNTKIKFRKWHILLFIIPILTLLILWTNDAHHLFYKVYSINLSETVTGPWANVHMVYSYLLLAIALIIFMRFSIKNSGFFSRQSILFLLGTLAPLIVNILGTYGILPMTIYLTPISFGIAVILFAFAIFKFQFLNVAPIALQRIVDQISDSYIIINDNYNITDFNKTFLDVFNLKASAIRNVNLFDLIKKVSSFGLDEAKLKKVLSNAKGSSKTLSYQIHLTGIEKHFNVEISSIVSNGEHLGTIILFKDITQHIIDMQTIENSQNLLMERERLASLGQLIGGIAHNLKTPIMSISGAAEGLRDLANEYDSSIEDPSVNFEDHHQIAKEMLDWIEKIKTHTAYMSDVITTVKGQAVVLSEEDANTFTIDELIKKVSILMKHELKNALVELKTDINVPLEFSLQGNVNSLVQVINNIISNAIQAYAGKPNMEIYLSVSEVNNQIHIDIEDFAGGLPDSVKDKLFKEMITTKGKNGTGLGLFMSYSTIRAHFDGDITFETEKGKGTVFTIIIPIK
ncbi:MAG: PAS domain S-box protein [Clostridia bacterium]|nr:PAS domain S-box protein [Clostridia bacterium]